MRRYIVLYQAPLSVAARLALATPQEAMNGVQRWIDWSERTIEAKMLNVQSLSASLCVIHRFGGICKERLHRLDDFLARFVALAAPHNACI